MNLGCVITDGCDSWRGVTPEDGMMLNRDPHPTDPNAVSVTVEGRKVGYVRKDYQDMVTADMMHGLHNGTLQARLRKYNVEQFTIVVE